MKIHVRVTTLVMVLVLILALPLNALAAILEVGSTGSDVVKVQQRLIQWGYLTDSADGKYGTKTRDAVIKFQKNNGLATDGRVGTTTAAKMGTTLSCTSSGSDSSSSGSDSSSSGSDSSSSGSDLSSSTSYISADHQLLSKMVYAEARGETYKGQVAVAAVVLNRVASSSFPNTISGVIYQSGAFSCVSNGTINKTPDSTAIRAALDALNGWDPTGGCLYYYNPKLTSSGSWIRSRTVKTVIGRHHFAG